MLLLDAPIEHGVSSTMGRTGIRRVNEMHGMYDISNDDMLYVLSTFVVCPVDWINSYEWRNLTDREVTALTDYYRLLGKRMGIKGIPEDYAGFEKLMEEYEIGHFTYSPRHGKSRTRHWTCWVRSRRSICCRARGGAANLVRAHGRSAAGGVPVSAADAGGQVVVRGGSRRVAWRSRCCFRRAVNRCSAGRLRRCAATRTATKSRTGHVQARLPGAAHLSGPAMCQKVTGPFVTLAPASLRPQGSKMSAAGARDALGR